MLAFFFKLLGPLVRVGVSLLHESQSPFFRSSLNILSSLREQVAQIDQSSFVNAQEHDAVDLRSRVLLISLQSLRPQGLKHNVRLQIVQNLVVSEVRESWKIQDGLLFSQLVILVVEDLHLACLDKVHLFDARLVRNYCLSWLVNPTVQVDDQLVDETSLALFEKVRERPLEFLKLESLKDKLGLHPRGHELVELELLDNQVVIVQKGLVDVVFDVVVEVWLDVERFVRLFYLFNPHVQRVKFFIDEVLKVVRGIENTVNRPHQEREKDESNELENNGEKVLVRCLTCVVSISNGGDNFEDPIESEYVLRMHGLLGKSGVASALVSPRVLAMWNVNIIAVLHLTQVQPDAG